MFKIALSESKSDYRPNFIDPTEADTLGRLAIAERWVGDLGNGVITLGERTAALHGLPNCECGLLSIMRCYDQADRAYILELFEQAATSSCSFCFSTTITGRAGGRPVFCIGESSGMEERYAGSITGIFVFPRFSIEHDA